MEAFQQARTQVPEGPLEERPFHDAAQAWARGEQHRGTAEFDPHRLLPERFGIQWGWSDEQCRAALGHLDRAEQTGAIDAMAECGGEEYPVAFSFWTPGASEGNAASTGVGLRSVSVTLYDPAEFCPEQFLEGGEELPDDEAFWKMVEDDYEAELEEARDAWTEAVRRMSICLGQDALVAARPDAGWLPTETEALAGWRTPGANFEMEMGFGGGDWPVLHITLTARPPAAPFVFDRPEPTPRHPYEALFSPTRYR